MIPLRSRAKSLAFTPRPYATGIEINFEVPYREYRVESGVSQSLSMSDSGCIDAIFRLSRPYANDLRTRVIEAIEAMVSLAWCSWPQS